MGAKLFVNGKVGEDYIRIISSAPSLSVWLDHHPMKDYSDSPVWIGYGPYNRRKQMTYAAARKMLSDTAKRAGIKKRVHFYLFRHTRIDETQGKLTEAQQCMMFGWKFGSRMPGVYFKRSGKHIDNAQAIMNGVKPGAQKPMVVLKPQSCIRCGLENSPAAKFCNRCGYVLTLETAVTVEEEKKEIDEWLNKLVANPEFLRKLLSLFKEAKLA